jgi:hypothetical protein
MTMKRTLRRAAGLGALAALALVTASCDTSLTETPKDILVPDNLYLDATGFQSGLNALYALVRQEREGVANANQLMQEISAAGVDNAFANYPADIEHLWNDWGVRNNPQESYFLDEWSWLYRTINAANTIIGRAENPEVDWTPEEHDRTVAEARLIRAWAYRHLTYLWGAVPMPLEESSGENIKTDWERVPVEQVRAQIEADLLYAEEHLPMVAENSGRVSKAVAEHYLAELYLAEGQPAKAEEKARAVIDSGEYSLITERYGVRAMEPGVPFMDQFVDGNVNRSQGNTEVLWAFEAALNTPGGGELIMRRYWVNRYYNLKGVQVTVENGGRAIGRLSPTAWAIDAYEPQDDRGSLYAIRKFYLYNDAGSLPEGAALGDTLWLSWEEEGENDPAWPSTRKWDWADPNDIGQARQYGDEPYLRLAETYLLLAEAQLDQGKLEEAALTLNVVRARSHASPISAADVTLDFILDERSRELLTEEQRRYTLLRTHTWLDRVQRYNPLAGPNVQPRDTLLPIPQAVIDANIDAPMEQNPGY